MASYLTYGAGEIFLPILKSISLNQFKIKYSLSYLLPSEMRKLPSKKSRNHHMYNRKRKSKNGCDPSLQRHHRIREKDDKHHLPHSFDDDTPGLDLEAALDAAQRQTQHAERAAEEEYSVTDPQQISVLHELGVEESQQHREQDTVHGVVDVLGGRGLRVHEAQVGQQGSQQDEQADHARHGRMLQLEDVPLVEGLQFVVLEAVPVQKAGQGQLSVRIHRFYAVVHGGGLLVVGYLGRFRRKHVFSSAITATNTISINCKQQTNRKRKNLKKNNN